MIDDRMNPLGPQLVGDFQVPEKIGVKRVGLDGFSGPDGGDDADQQPEGEGGSFVIFPRRIGHDGFIGHVLLESAPMSDPVTDSANRHVFRRLLRLLRPQWGATALAVVFLLLSLPAELFPGLTWMYVTDKLVLGNDTKSTAWLHTLFSFDGRVSNKFHLLYSALTWMFLIYLFAETFETLSNFVMNVVAQRFTLKLRNQVYQKLQSQSLGYLHRQRVGDLMSRAMGDVDEVQSFLVNGIDQILGEGLLWLGCVTLVMLLDWKVASTSLAPLLIVYVLLRIFNRKVAPMYKAVRDAAGNVSTRLQENLSGLVVIKIFGREKQEAGRFRVATEQQYAEQFRSIKARSTFFPLTRVVGFFSNVFMLGVGGYSILAGGSFTIGKMLAFRAYWWRLFGPINTLARVNDMVQRATAAGRRVFEVLDAPDELPDAPDAINVEHVRGEMELKDVSFSYHSQRRVGTTKFTASTEKNSTGSSSVNSAVQPLYVLQDVSIKIEPGKSVALCGPSGGGKSTILNLLLRFYDPIAGSVTLDGRDLRSINRDSLRRHFALVQQETFLFNDSILDNIRYGHGEATMEQVVAAARAANAHGFISKMPDGYNTKVGERGVRLSGGQKQRISIARAFLANPSILLLDEPTSSVEPDSEAAIIAALDRLMINRTSVVTSHRPSLINQADWVYVIEDGRVTEQGPPAQLAANGGWFGRFMRSGVEEENVGA
jgi:ABC-type multidrug transport system fused ATPase/permease subunit